MLLVIYEAYLSWAAGWEWRDSGRRAGEISPGCPPHTQSQRSTGTCGPPPWPHTSSPQSPGEGGKKTHKCHSSGVFITSSKCHFSWRWDQCGDLMLPWLFGTTWGQNVHQWQLTRLSITHILYYWVVLFCLCSLSAVSMTANSFISRFQWFN